MKLIEKKTNNPNYIKKQLEKGLRCSDSTITRQGRNMKMASPQNGKIKKKKNSKLSLPSWTKIGGGSQSHEYKGNFFDKVHKK